MDAYVRRKEFVVYMPYEKDGLFSDNSRLVDFARTYGYNSEADILYSLCPDDIVSIYPRYVLPTFTIHSHQSYILNEHVIVFSIYLHSPYTHIQHVFTFTVYLHQSSTLIQHAIVFIIHLHSSYTLIHHTLT